MTENKGCCAGGGNLPKIREAVCIDTNRVYDSCADKDCLADLRVYFSPKIQEELIENAVNVKCRGVDLLYVSMDVEKVPFNKGCYSVDLTFYFKVTVEVYTSGCAHASVVEGFTTFSKKCILYGGEGAVHVYSSEYRADADDKPLRPTDANPRAKIQVADPICLGARLCKVRDCCCDDCGRQIPACVRNAFSNKFPPECTCCECKKVVAVTIGIFSIVQLERDVQMLIPAYDFCIPQKECCCDTDDPCEAFRKICFPVDEFFPPQDGKKKCCGCDEPFHVG